MVGGDIADDKVPKLTRIGRTILGSSPKMHIFAKASGLAPPQPANVQIQPPVSWFMASTGPLVPSGLRKIALKGLINFNVFKSINTLCSLFIKNDERMPNNLVDAMKINDRYQDIEQILNGVLYGPPKI